MLDTYVRATNALLGAITSVRSSRGAETLRRSAWLPPEVQTLLANAARGAASRGLAPIASASLSQRLRNGYVVVSRPGALFAEMGAEDWLITGPREIEAGTSLLPPWHRDVYERTVAQSVLLVQPPYALVAAYGPPVSTHWLDHAFTTPVAVATGPFEPGMIDVTPGVWLVPGTGLLAWGVDAQAVVELAARTELLCRVSLIATAASLPETGFNPPPR